ncbi:MULTISPECIES: DUF4437 domain-containing protein [Aliiglaciecola]|uniref:DUF4437 domain-containing protein n=1 Tax=Aliiglaciecola TaxID=1406885 RepID=UPI001C091552|nr:MULTISPECIES: DUF4437 domain-containing protein [Aliiglaciecola]MBU2879042.1 DUF4437 domain-containing protein [Aliiglaciecola lipolytica]MDO6710740.1 DUF4437 domain-containing protein [Aliiglaciecola sp. 2_MG-2023]MDO6751852.1 DUF4437 domain-containing protein [Aliiglaciecola sp. 1_MG-2023]
MRPHVEMIDEKDLIWHPSELKGATEGEARQRNLSYDEEDGSVSAKILFDTYWARPAGVHVAQTEWYVLGGEVKIGDEVLIEGGYWCTPPGVLCPAIEVKPGTEILYFREFGTWEFEEASADKEGVREDQKLVVKHSNLMDWVPVEIGSPMDFSAGGTPVPGLFIKLLFRDEKTDFYTRLIKAKPDWVEHPLAHHPVYEEAYTLQGTFEFNFGEQWPGVYFFRPPLIRHGDFKAGPEGATWLLRCDGRLVDWYTDNAKMEMHGDPVNWGPDYPGTQDPAPLQPVRSKSLGPMKDPYYS